MQVEVVPQYDLESMWRQVRLCARATVGKEDVDTPVSGKFKAKMLISEHSPVRELRFIIRFKGVPTYVAQQFSRHRIAIANPGEFYRYLDENVIPTDVEHYVRTQRSDRTGEARGSQEAPVDYQCVVNAQGLIDMSKKRLCQMASPAAQEAWMSVVAELQKVEPLLAKMLVPSCLYRKMCPECNTDCGFPGSDRWNEMRIGLMAVRGIAMTK